jgi:hypothetical protein
MVWRSKVKKMIPLKKEEKEIEWLVEEEPTKDKKKKKKVK